MEFNDLFNSKNLMDTVKTLFKMSINKMPMEVYHASVEEPKYSFTECVKFKLNYNYKINYKIGLKDTNVSAEGSFEVPKMYQGSYILMDDSNSYHVRTPVKSIDIYKPVSIFKTVMVIRGVLSIENYKDKDRLEIVIENERFSMDDFLANEFKLSTGDKRVADAFNYYLNKDLPFENGEWIIDSYSVKELYDLAISDPDLIDEVSIFDMKFNSSGDSFLKHIKYNKPIIDYIRNRYFRSKGEEEFGVINVGNSVDRFISAYFRMQSQNTNDLQKSADTNAVDQLSQTNKVFFLERDKEGGEDKTVIHYRNEYIGIIDPVETHEGPNTGKRNSIASDCIIRDGEAFIRLIDKNENLVEVSLIKQFNSKILATTNWNYRDHKPILEKNGKVKALYRGKYIEVDLSDTDYRRPSAFSTFSYTTSLIPRVNSVDSVRGAMSTAMSNQSIPVLGAQPPVVGTGIEKEIFNRSGLNIRAGDDGKVVGILNDAIKVMTNDGNEVIYFIPDPINTTSNTFNFYRPLVKVGDIIKKGQVIITIDSFVDNQFSITVPMVVAYASYYGYEFEDGMVLSKSAAEKLGHRARSVIEIPIWKANSYVFDKEQLLESKYFNATQATDMMYLNDFLLPEIGDKVRPDMMLFSYLSELDPELDKMAKFKKILNPNEVTYKVNITRLSQSINNGTISDIEVIVPATEDFSAIKDMYDYYTNIRKSKVEEDSKFLGKAREHHNSYLTEGCIGVIRITIDYINQMKEGDKVSNRFGSKGLSTKIVDDELMPTLEDGTKVDCMISPYSVINRKNTSQILVGYLGLASVTSWKSNSSKLANNKYDEVREVLNSLYVTDRFSSMSDSELLEFHNKYNGYYQIDVEPYDTRYSESSVKNIEKHTGVPISGSQKLKYPNGRTTRQPVVTVVDGIERLHFIVEDKAKVTASGGMTDGNLVLGMGNIKLGGQKLGGQEVYSLLAHGADKLLDELGGGSKVNHRSDILQQFWALGLDLLEVADDNDLGE